MTLTNTQKALLGEDEQVLIEAGFLTADLKITDSCRYYMEHLDFVAKKAKIVARAKEKVAEAKADCADCE